MPTNLDLFMGNWANDDSVGSGSLWNDIPKFAVPLRYFMTCFSASMWPGEGLH